MQLLQQKQEAAKQEDATVLLLNWVALSLAHLRVCVCVRACVCACVCVCVCV